MAETQAKANRKQQGRDGAVAGAAPGEIMWDTSGPDLEAAADQLILRGLEVAEVAKFVQALPAGTASGFYALLLFPAEVDSPRRLAEQAITLGSYFSSRLTARGFILPAQLEECMYALADAVKASSPIDVIRWRSVFMAMSPEAQRSSAMTRFIRQSDRALRMLCTLTKTESRRHEHRVLKILRAIS
jgi:hypothetical protein